MTIKLVRFHYGDEGTFGRLYLPSGIILYTVERPWLDNRTGISCIPEGLYSLQQRRFFRGGYDTWEIAEVPSRMYILFHVANWPREVEGCVGLGTTLNLCKNMVVNSRQAFSFFKEEADDLWAAHKALAVDIQSVHAVLAAA